jgi:scyllo-inositol 2-dehydrogenase (NADP+)
MHSKVTNSSLPSEIIGEIGNIQIDSISSPQKVEIVYLDGSKEDITREQDKEAFRYEVEEFVLLIIEGNIESKVNSYNQSIQVMEILTKVRQLVGITYPADLK